MSHFWMIHTFFMSAALVTFGISFFVGLLFLCQERQLKNHRPILAWLQRLPSLEVIDSLHYRGLFIGFLLLSLGMISGAFLSKSLSGAFFTSDPRQIASLVTWGIYALFLNVRIRSGWRGRRGILLSLVGFLTVALTFIAIHHRD
ncbi:MAG: cytochrome c biogenesis protein CcsA [Deltaproteobacteria bacterium]|nr:cytochrome c biogenesis protein CcsA [Deltaproteobacteria bacterium]